ncbi:MAG: sugar ABC transporter permease, partial [Nitrososphaerota archaeon]|nr:sugar ABC transporter permease [Nitrososphaerota archaeon]
MSVSLSAPSSNLSSYVSLFAQTDFGRVVYNTVFFAVGTAVVSVLVGAAFAILVDSRRRAKRAISLIAYLPYMIPFTASALIWATLFNPGYGPLDPILTSLGLPAINWLGPALQLYSLTMVGVWTSIPLAFLIILAGLSSVPKQVKEAASVDGMEMWDYYSSVALPLAKGAVITAFLMVMILGFGNFDLPYILSGAGGVPPVTMATMVVYAYAEMFYANLAPQGLAAAIFVALLASIPGLLLVRTTLGASKDGRGRTWLPRLRVPRVHLPGSRRAFNAPFRYILYLVCSLVSVFILFPVY